MVWIQYIVATLTLLSFWFKLEILSSADSRVAVACLAMNEWMSDEITSE